MASRKRRQVDYETYTRHTLPSENPAATTRHHHTDFEQQTEGGLSMSTHFLAQESSHPKPVRIYAALGDETITAHANPSFEPLYEIYDGVSHNWLDPDDVDVIEEPAKRRRTVATDNPLEVWKVDIDHFLHELLRLDGPADIPISCARCQAKHASLQPFYRCLDCLDCRFRCSTCLVSEHRHLPFHRVELWDGSSFTSSQLGALGVTIPLGHTNAEDCPRPTIIEDFTVLHTNGLHTVTVSFCDCGRGLFRTTQLLRARLFPSTTIYPQTAATFELLHQFQLLSFMSKVSAFEFYQTLVRLTDNTGTMDLADRYAPFLRMVREWRHLKMLKQSGRGHSPSGAGGTQPGECAVRCPACPIPGVNLPDDWKKAPPHESWRYALFIAIDANFRLKRLNSSSMEKDPSLNQGCAYFVEDETFKEYLKQFLPHISDDISTCSNHDAIKSASIRGGKGVDASGVGKIECARHDMKRPASVGDLQKGEKYVNMDYFFLSSIADNVPTEIKVSYDISCQWSRGLRDRCQIYHGFFNLHNPFRDHTFSFLVPKFHLLAHIDQCQVDFSFNFTPNVGRTDGESPERGWAALNAVANSTKEMGPGSRHDTLDDHFADYNWRKIISMPSAFVRKAEEAISQREEHVLAFKEFDAALPEADVLAWTAMVHAWEKNPKIAANPFKSMIQKISEAEVRLQLAQEDEARLHEVLADDIHTVVHNEILPPSRFIAQGLELEDHQRLLRIDIKALGPQSTHLQRSKVIERSNRIFRRIEAWTTTQLLYMPFAATLRLRDDQLGNNEHVATANVKLYLPSDLIGKAPCDSSLLDIEWRLRYAHAHETLYSIRSAILLRSQMYKSKDSLSRGQRMHTRSLALIHTVDERITQGMKKYNEIRSALSSLAPVLKKDGWAQVLRVLTDADTAGITALEDTRSEGTRSVGWIWKLSNSKVMDDEGNQEALRIEWCKARARAHRWQEECVLLNEEMRRVLAYLNYQENIWRTHAIATYSHVDAATVRGLQAYARRQATIQSRLRVVCQETWSELKHSLTVGVGAPVGKQYVVEHDSPVDK